MPKNLKEVYKKTTERELKITTSDDMSSLMRWRKVRSSLTYLRSLISVYQASVYISSHLVLHLMAMLAKMTKKNVSMNPSKIQKIDKLNVIMYQMGPEVRQNFREQLSL